jgi:hypothetical protein
MLEQLITTVLTYLNAGSYYKSAEEIKNAINIAQLDLYKRLRGNLAQYAPGRPSSAITPGETNVTADAISELYDEVIGGGATNIISMPFSTGLIRSIDPLTGQQLVYNRTIDVVLSIEVDYLTNPGKMYPVNIVPDNQFLMMKNNPVIPPVETRPLGRLYPNFSFEITPNPINSYLARVLTLPNPVDFTFQDIGAPLPKIIIPAGKNIDWSIDKLDNMVYGTVANLGFNLSNGVLVQSGNAMNDKIL